MLGKIDTAIRALIVQELGYTVDPDTQSFQNLRDDEFPVCLLQYDEERASDDQTIGNFTNDIVIGFEIITLSDEDDYRAKAFEQLSRFKAFINNARELVESQYPEACIIDMDYEGASILGFDSTRVAGGILVETVIKYQQCRTNPELPACCGTC